MYKSDNDVVGHDEVVKQATQRAPFGPGIPEAQLAAAVRMEVWNSAFSDPGPDFCEFRCFDVAGTRVATGRVAGY